mmetsp:Transcript_8642/g.25930  ORF Transcript_8642/g.25930 Transcript_8642/m.25930 type:complete len:436 (-) Transcript_8642:262-1569(-)
MSNNKTEGQAMHGQAQETTAQRKRDTRMLCDTFDHSKTIAGSSQGVGRWQTLRSHTMTLKAGSHAKHITCWFDLLCGAGAATRRFCGACRPGLGARGCAAALAGRGAGAGLGHRGPAAALGHRAAAATLAGGAGAGAAAGAAAAGSRPAVPGAAPPAGAAAGAGAAGVLAVVVHAHVALVERVAELGVVQVTNGGLQVLTSVKLHHAHHAVAVVEHIGVAGLAALAEVVLQVLPAGRDGQPLDDGTVRGALGGHPHPRPHLPARKLRRGGSTSVAAAAATAVGAGRGPIAAAAHGGPAPARDLNSEAGAIEVVAIAPSRCVLGIARVFKLNEGKCRRPHGGLQVDELDASIRDAVPLTPCSCSSPLQTQVQRWEPPIHRSAGSSQACTVPSPDRRRFQQWDRALSPSKVLHADSPADSPAFDQQPPASGEAPASG